MTLDRLSGGRLVLPVGLGALDDAAFGNVGEATDARIRAERLDETPRDPRGPVVRRAVRLRRAATTGSAR